MAGLLSPGYLESRLAWVAIAVALVVVGGLIYVPHKAKKRAVLTGRLGALLNAGRPPRALPDAPAAKRAFASALNLVTAEFRLIGSGRAFLLLATAVGVIAAVAPDFRHASSPAALLLLFSGVQLIVLGIMGTYIGGIYDEVKRRPRYIVDEKINL